MVDEHSHKWKCYRGSMVICHLCNTVAEIGDLLANTEAKAKTAAKVSLLSSQLFAGDLKKDARDAAYMWVRVNDPDTIEPVTVQEALL